MLLNGKDKSWEINTAESIFTSVADKVINRTVIKKAQKTPIEILLYKRLQQFSAYKMIGFYNMVADSG